jgi:hypothetical protein
MKESILFDNWRVFNRINNYVENRGHMHVSFRKIGHIMKEKL